MPTPPPSLILASTSRYRKRLLRRLQLAFAQRDPAVDETPLPAERPAALALRLAHAKAAAVADRYPAALVIGSDQVASIGTEILGKPGTPQRAQAQLARCSGNTVNFYTGLAVHCAGRALQLGHLDTVTVYFRQLCDADITTYLRLDQPWDCAGSFRIESLGSTLFTGIDSRDPSALEGLPLIALCQLLSAAGLPVLTQLRESHALL